jgi:hypothetical protein
LAVIRPELRTAIWKAREAIFAAAILLFGLWCMWLGGWVLIPLGIAVAALGAALGVLALRRMRFGQGVHAPGVVEVDEAQISYFGPDGGGFLSVPDLVELRLTWIAGKRFWRLKQFDGQAMLLPVDAAGAERLFDVFASLPGMDTQALVSAVGSVGKDSRRPSVPGGLVAGSALGPILWQRRRRPALDSA